MTTPVSVLLVEDSDADARYVEELLDESIAASQERFPGLPDADDEVAMQRHTSLAGAVKALETDSDQFDVVLLDLHLDDSEGLDTLDSLLETTRRVPVVVLTGVDDTAVGAAAVRAGAQDFLVKDDVTREMLERAIRYAIQRHETAQALHERTEQLAMMNQLTRHDVRNDISLIVGHATELRESVDERYTDQMTEIITASNHVLQLTRTIGDAVSAVSEADESRLGPVDLCRILDQEVEKARDLYEPATIEVHTDCEELTVWADSLLSSVFGNIISNAAIYNDERTPVIDIEVRTEGETAVISFADNGPGISPRQRRELFSRDSASLDGSGLGIGLYLVRRLVDRYNGDIDISNNEPKGTVFTLELNLV
jgi:signal transduction histidine kinase